jgi:pyrimidine operon attenuation protein/uracil phosphoribosyltransferase
LPIRADAIGLEIETRRNETVKVRVAPFDPADEVLRSIVEADLPNSEPAR